MNDLPLSINSGPSIALYADDTKIWRPIKSESEQEILQSDINSLNQWAHDKKMRFHPKKCKVLSIGRKLAYSIDAIISEHAKRVPRLLADFNMN
jgi:hypothetical protein